MDRPAFATHGFKIGDLDVSTRVLMAPMSEEEVAAYVASGETDDKAGAYAMQGIGGLFVARIEGSPSNVVGLPVRLLYTLARELGVPLTP